MCFCSPQNDFIYIYTISIPLVIFVPEWICFCSLQAAHWCADDDGATRNWFKCGTHFEWLQTNFSLKGGGKQTRAK